MRWLRGMNGNTHASSDSEEIEFIGEAEPDVGAEGDFEISVVDTW